MVDDEPHARDLLDIVLQRPEPPSNWQPPQGKRLNCFTSRGQTFLWPISECRERMDLSSFAKCERAPSCLSSAPAPALTAYARAEERAQVFSAGLQSHMTKPVEPAELIAAVACVLEEAGKVKSLGQSS